MRTALGVSIATVALADDDGPPVPDELIGRLYRSSRHGINELVSGLRRAVVEALQRFAIVELIYTISDWLLPRPAIWKHWWRQGVGLVIFYLNNLANCRTRKNHDSVRSKPKSVWRQSILPIHRARTRM